MTCLASRSRSTTLVTRAASVGTTPTAPLAATAARLPLAVAAAGRRPVRAAAGSSSRTSPATSRGRYGLDLSLAIPFPTPLSSPHLRPRRMVEMDAEPSACGTRACAEGRVPWLPVDGRPVGRPRRGAGRLGLSIRVGGDRRCVLDGLAWRQAADDMAPVVGKAVSSLSWRRRQRRRRRLRRISPSRTTPSYLWPAEHEDF